jgi:L-threonylcarbamoyladenylate synthase
MIVSVEKAIELLNSGEVVAVPTETVYGLAGLASNEEALKKIFAVKHRPHFDPLIVHVSDVFQAREVVDEWPSAATMLAGLHWPGPLTMVLKKAATLSPLITAGLPHVAVRMPNHPLALEILRATGPLAAPSANKFGKTSPTRAAHVEESFAGQVAVVDGGDSAVGIESTVIKIEESEKNIEVFILRPGPIGEKEILECLEPSEKWVTVQIGTSKDSPGQLESHYQPDKPLVVADHGIEWTPELHQKICQQLKQNVQCQPSVWILSEKSPEIVARTLYVDMREQTSKAQNGSYVFLKLPEEYYRPNWIALRDRIDKASFLKIKQIENSPSLFLKNEAP